MLWHGLPTVPLRRPEVSLAAAASAKIPPCRGSDWDSSAMECYRVTEDAAVYFVTYTVVEWLPVFVSERECRIVTDSLNYCHENKALHTNGYVIMPTHLHAILFDADFRSDRLVRSLAGFRKFTGRQLCDYCETHDSGSRADTRRPSSRSGSGSRSWTTFTRIHAAKAWCCARSTGDSRRPPIGCRTDRRRAR